MYEKPVQAIVETPDNGVQGNLKFKYDLNMNQLELLENIGTIAKTREEYFPSSIYCIEYILSKESQELYQHFYGNSVNRSKDFSLLIDDREFQMLQNGVSKSTLKLSKREENQALLSWYYLHIGSSK